VGVLTYYNQFAALTNPFLITHYFINHNLVVMQTLSNNPEEAPHIVEVLNQEEVLRLDISKVGFSQQNHSGKVASIEKKVLFGADKKKKGLIFKEEGRSRKPPIQTFDSDPQVHSNLEFRKLNELKDDQLGIYKSPLEDKTSNRLSHLRAQADSKGSNQVPGSSTGVLTGYDLQMASVSPVLFSKPHAKSLKSHRPDRARSLQKPGKEAGFGKKLTELSSNHHRQQISSHSNKQVVMGFWEKEFLPSIRTRVISRGSKQTLPIREGQPIKEEGLMANQPKPIPRNLTELLQEMNNSTDSISMNLDDEEEFDFDKESKKCEEQISQIKDAYVVDLPDLNGDKENGSPVNNQDIAFDGKADDDTDKQGSSSVFKKIAYFTSVAATTGFYFLMRRHQIL
jgi:hypothetical protein